MAEADPHHAAAGDGLAARNSNFEHDGVDGSDIPEPMQGVVGTTPAPPPTQGGASATTQSASTSKRARESSGGTEQEGSEEAHRDASPSTAAVTRTSARIATSTAAIAAGAAAGHSACGKRTCTTCAAFSGTKRVRFDEASILPGKASRTPIPPTSAQETSKGKASRTPSPQAPASGSQKGKAPAQQPANKDKHQPQQKKARRTPSQQASQAPSGGAAASVGLPSQPMGVTLLECFFCTFSHAEARKVCGHMNSHHRGRTRDTPLPAWAKHCEHDKVYYASEANHAQACTNPWVRYPGMPADTNAASSKIIESLKLFDRFGVDDLKWLSFPSNTFLPMPEHVVSRCTPVLDTIISVMLKAAGTSDACFTAAFVSLHCFLLHLTALPAKADPLEDEAEGIFIPQERSKEDAVQRCVTVCNLWVQGHGPRVFLQAVDRLRAHREANTPSESSPEAQRRLQVAGAALEVSRGGLSKAANRLESRGIAPGNTETLSKVRALHPAPTQAEAEVCEREMRESEKLLRSLVPETSSWCPFTVGDVSTKIGDMKLESAADLSGLRVCHLQLLAKCRFTPAVRDILLFTIRGTLPEAVSRYIWSGRCLPLKKGENGIRPITVPSLWNRLLGSIVLEQCGWMAETMEPLQVGVSTPSGTETTAALMQTALLENPGHVALKFDMKNAYNSLHRSAVYSAVRKRKDATLLAYTLQAYGLGPSECLFRGDKTSGSTVIPCSSGVRQGDSLSPLLFALALHPVLVAISSRQAPPATASNTPAAAEPSAATPAQDPELRFITCAPDVTSGYLDDILAVATPEVGKDLVAFEVQRELDAHNTGLTLVREKTEAYSPGQDLTRDEGWKCKVISPDEGLVVLGVPVGSPRFIAEHVAKVVDSMVPLLESLQELPLQHAFLLLRYCVTSKINTLLRTCPMALTAEAAKRFDGMVWDCVRKLLAIPEDACDRGFNLERAKAVIALPLRMGGCGLAAASLSAPSAFVAGVASAYASLKALRPEWAAKMAKLFSEGIQPDSCAIDLKGYSESLKEALLRVQGALRRNDALGRAPITPERQKSNYPVNVHELFDKKGKLQKDLTLLFLGNEQASIFEHMGEHQKASMLSRCSPHALDFLRAVPSSPSLFIESGCMQYALRRMLFLPVSNDALPPSRHPTVAEVSNTEDPEVRCRAVLRDKASCSAYVRHTKLIQQISRMLRGVGYRTWLEPRVPSVENHRKRGDICMIDNHRITYLDFSGVSSQRVDTLAKAAKEVGAAAKFAAKKKRDMYEAECKAAGFEFLPLIMEEDGLFHDDFLGLIRTCAQRSSVLEFAVPEFTTWAAPSFESYWAQVFSIAFLEGSEEMWRGGVSKRNALLWGFDGAMGDSESAVLPPRTRAC